MRGQYHRLRKATERARKQWMTEMKAEMACFDCGASYPQEPSKLVWDHRPGEIKVGNISDMVGKGLIDEVLEEIKKCDLVCASCHAKRGLERGQIRSGPQSEGHCAYCGIAFRCRASARRKFCCRRCSAASRRKVRLKIHHWRPPRQPVRRWWYRRTIYDSQGNVLEQYDEQGNTIAIAA